MESTPSWPFESLSGKSRQASAGGPIRKRKMESIARIAEAVNLHGMGGFEACAGFPQEVGPVRRVRAANSECLVQTG